MDKFDRFQILHRIFTSHKHPVSIRKIAEELECTEKNAKRLIYSLRDYWQAPIEYSDERKGWHYQLNDGEKFELPGLWLTAEELQSITALLQLLHNMDDGVLLDELTIIEETIHKLLDARGVNSEDFTRTIKYLPMAKRQIQAKAFTTIAEALLKKQRIDLVYRDYHGQLSQRCISPQQLIYYRENWLVDAWCHLRADLRTFSVSRIEKADINKTHSKIISIDQLQDYFSSSYGIFSGTAKHTAKLKFLPEVAREVAAQRWHPEQIGEWSGDEFLLQIPYNNDTELVMDILKYGNNVEVLEPEQLKQNVINKLRGALLLYRE